MLLFVIALAAGVAVVSFISGAGSGSGLHQTVGLIALSVAIGAIVPAVLLHVIGSNRRRAR